MLSTQLLLSPLENTSPFESNYEPEYSRYLNLEENKDLPTQTRTPAESIDTSSIFSQDLNENYFKLETKLQLKSKRITKREQAKSRTNKKRGTEIENNENISENKDLNEKDKKKIQQKIRNRISAQQSRDRKKIYMETLENENRRLFLENESLKQEIMNLRFENQSLRNKDPLDYEIPIINEESQNYGGSSKLFTIGLGMFGLLSICMILGFSLMDNNQINLQKENLIYSGKELAVYENNTNYSALDINFNQKKWFGKGKSNWGSEFAMLKNIKQLRNDIIYKLFKIKEKNNNFIENNIEEEEETIEKNIKFLQDKKKNSPVVLYNQENFKTESLSTMFCPTTYIYQENNSSLTRDNYRNPEWIHLLIPKQNMPKFWLQEDQILITNIRKDDVRIEEEKLVEMWCKVYGMREVQEKSSLL